MSLRHAILGIVEFAPMHGYQIKGVLEEGISAFWPVKLAAIYPSLHRLEEEGLVTHCTQVTGDGRPSRKVYEITDSGREELARWRHLPPEDGDRTRVPLYLKLFFAKAENLPDALEWIDKALELARGRAEGLRGELENPKAFSTFFVRFMRESGLAHTELQIELLQELRARVAQKVEAYRQGQGDWILADERQLGSPRRRSSRREAKEGQEGS